MELATPLNTAKSGGLIMAAIAQVFTISYVANLLGESEDLAARPLDRHRSPSPRTA